MEWDHTRLHSTLHLIRYCKTQKHYSNARIKVGPITVYTSINLVAFSTVKYLHGNRRLNGVIINLGITSQLVRTSVNPHDYEIYWHKLFRNCLLHLAKYDILKSTGLQIYMIWTDQHSERAGITSVNRQWPYIIARFSGTHVDLRISETLHTNWNNF
jgi:hypothetical protein